MSIVINRLQPFSRAGLNDRPIAARNPGGFDRSISQFCLGIRKSLRLPVGVGVRPAGSKILFGSQA
jgi:hypothetical protein